MNNYIIISPDGYTESPCNNAIENFQVIAFVSARDEEHAIEVMYEENEWLNAEGYSEFIVKELKN